MKGQNQQQYPLKRCKCFWKILVLGAAIATIVPDLSKLVRQPQTSAGQVWASWIGEVPTAAELYGDSSSAFEDDDDDDEGLDSAASNEYPDGKLAPICREKMMNASDNLIDPHSRQTKIKIRTRSATMQRVE